MPKVYWCPTCHKASLEHAVDGLDCGACGARYPVVNQVPVLINDANSVFSVADYLGTAAYSGASYGSSADAVTGLRGWYRRWAHSLAETGIKPDHLDSRDVIAKICKEAPERPRILIIGAGTVRYPDAGDFVYTDVAFSAGIDAIVDAHDLPLADASFDMVMAVAVLEHVADPARVVGEIWRVLKPQGFVYAVTPFLQPVHMGAYDFTRFTYLGHRRLFRRFSDEASGLALGPGAVSAWAFRSLLLSLSSNKAYRRIANLLGLLVSVPMKYLDYFTRHHRAALDGAGGVYFFGRKQESAISDRALIKLYRGGFD
jgi:SAM-dependent methyltransferase